MLRTVVDLTFLLLAVLLITMLLSSSGKAIDSQLIANEIELLRGELRVVTADTLQDVEGKVSKLTHTQDSYQSTTAKRIHVLEQRVKIIEGIVESGRGSKIINTNNNIVNVSKTEDVSKL